jgi:Mlc titration factor MtfA (ptsG expression regulator)
VTGPFRSWRRKRILARPFPDEWLGILRERVPFYRRLSAEQRGRFHEYLQIFLAEKRFVGAGGLTVTEEMRVVVGAVAVRLVLGLDLSYYDRMSEVVIYPGDFRRPHTTGTLLGEFHRWGTVVLSWDAVLYGLADPCDGHDTAAHEFAHALDKSGGAMSGTPRLRAKEHYRAWAEVMSRHFFRLREGAAEEADVLRDYGGKNEAEFFAVAVESFFERSRKMRDETPDLYHELSRFFGQDPAADDPC